MLLQTRHPEKRPNIVGDSVAKGADVTKAHTAGEVSQVLKIDMSNLSMVEEGVTLKETSLKIEVEVKTPRFEDDENNGMVTISIIMIETIGIDMEIIKVMLTGVEDGMVIEVKVAVTGVGEDAGTPIPIIHNRAIHSNHNTQTPIIIVHLQWVININTKCPMNSIPAIRNSRPNISHKECQHNHTKLQIYVNCVRIRAIMIIIANLQVTLWPEHRKLLTKDTPTVTKTQIKVTGLMGKMTIMTQIASFFSKGGSRCH